MMRRWMAGVVAAFLAFGMALGGCIATETGNPSLGPELDPQRIEGDIPVSDPGVPSLSVVTVVGRPGAIDPPEGMVLGWGVEAPGPPSTANVDDDGSFDLTVPATPGEIVRVVARAPDGAPSAPFDFRVTDAAGLTPVEPARACLALDPPGLAWVEAGEEVRVALVNGCDEAVTRERARLRDPASSMVLVDEGALTLAPGESAVVVVQAPVPAAELVIFPIDGAAPELRVFSVFAD